MKKKAIKQGEVWMCNLPKGEDSEQMGVRPCLVMSLDIRNETSSNVFVFPITHAKKKDQPCHYILYKEHYPFFGYMRATKFLIGILVNFGTDRRAQIERYHYADGRLFVY